MSKRESKASKMRTYQVATMALLEEREMGLLTDAEFSKRHKELWEMATGKEWKA